MGEEKYLVPRQGGIALDIGKAWGGFSAMSDAERFQWHTPTHILGCAEADGDDWRSVRWDQWRWRAFRWWLWRTAQGAARRLQTMECIFVAGLRLGTQPSNVVDRDGFKGDNVHTYSLLTLGEMLRLQDEAKEQ